MDVLGGRSGRGRSARGATEAEVFGDLFDRHARAVFAFCARRTADLSLAEDLTSIVFLEAWRNRRRTQLAAAENPLPWLLGVANNVVRNAIRSQQRYRAALRRLPAPSVVHGIDDDAVAPIETEEALREALRAIGSLSEGERDVVIFVLWSDLSYEEAALALGIPVGTVRSRLSRARSKLQSSLSNASTLSKGLS
jgi:RNA polymerase sigma-70 factor (ECF subfamily)